MTFKAMIIRDVIVSMAFRIGAVISRIFVGISIQSIRSRVPANVN